MIRIRSIAFIWSYLASIGRTCTTSVRTLLILLLLLTLFMVTLLLGPSQLDFILTNLGNQVNSSIGQDYAWSRPAKAKG